MWGNVCLDHLPCWPSGTLQCRGPYKCKECGKVFILNKSLLLYRLSPNRRETLVVKSRTTFSSKSNLADHKRMHGREKPHKWSECDEALARVLICVTLRDSTMEKSPVDYGRVFILKKSLILHFEASTRERFSMSAKTVESTGTFLTMRDSVTGRGHINVESVGKPLLWPKVSWSFRKKLHTQDKAFKGEDCGKAFSYHSSLLVL